MCKLQPGKSLQIWWTPQIGGTAPSVCKRISDLRSFLLPNSHRVLNQPCAADGQCPGVVMPEFDGLEGSLLLGWGDSVLNYRACVMN